MGYNYNSAGAGVLAGVGAGMIVLYIALIVFGIICMWKIFTKAGEAGWKCLIPVYNAIVFYRIAWEAKYFLYSLLAIVVASIISAIGVSANSSGLAGVGAFLMIVAYVLIAVLYIIAMVKLAKRFGKGGGFAVGLILLSIVFMAILAFDSSDYDRSRA